ncbi:MAG: pyridoxamine 5'-phosphate oxidase family protein [Myxococcales bacterium]|nr:pyridoxamine 5'-phosphate oxidase family protein [Myxococcales bacterium]
MSSASITDTTGHFVRTPRVGTFYESAAFFPMPVIVIVTCDAEGQHNVAPYSLCFPQPEAGDGMLMLISKRDSNTARNISATGKAALCFLPEDATLLDHCVELGRPAPPGEKMVRSKFTLQEVEGFSVIAEAEQVFLCSLEQFDVQADGKERRILLHVDEVMLQERWARALKRGWGAPRLAVEFGFRGQSARWLSRPRVHFGGPALRPTFEFSVNMSAAEVQESLQRALESQTADVEGFVRTGRAQINIPRAEATFWSPELAITIEDDGRRAKLHGRVGPHPQVWTLLMLLHLATAIIGGFGVFWGLSQWMVDQTPWAMLSIPGALIIHGLLLGAAFVGQGLGVEHVFRLRDFVDEALTH